jgi:hypothetical protein
LTVLLLFAQSKMNHWWLVTWLEFTVPYRSSAQMSCRGNVGVSFVALEILEPQTARHWFRSAATSRHLANSVGRSYSEGPFQSSGPLHLWAHEKSRIVDPTIKMFLRVRINGVRPTWPVHRRSRQL